MAQQSRTGKGDAGFTLAELLVVLVLVSLLAALAVPTVSGSVMRARETALTENLHVMRRAIDDFQADRGEYPDTLQDLAEARYISFVPDDPVAGEDAGWGLSLAPDDGGIEDIYSNAEGIGSNGIAYRSW